VPVVPSLLAIDRGDTLLQQDARLPTTPPLSLLPEIPNV